MIRLTLPNGQPVLINPMTVFSVHAANGGCFVTSGSGSSIEVTETVDEVDRRLKGWGKG